MKKRFSLLSIQLKTLLISLAVAAIINLALIPLIVINMYDIVVGIDIGIFLHCIYFGVDHLVSKQRNRKQNMTLMVVMLIVKFLILGGVLLFFGYLSYSLEIKIANIIAIVGGYTVPIIVMMICLLLERDKNGRSA